MTSSMWWPTDGSDEWLKPTDGILAIHLYRRHQARRTESNATIEPVLEVGVWKGAWVSTLLMNTSEGKVFGVDPYPNLDSIRSRMLLRLHELNVEERFNLYESLESLPKDLRFSIIHLDGEHSESALGGDLQYAAEHLAEDGIIIVDDFRNFWFPGVSSAVYRGLEPLGLRIFATTSNKAYISRREYADELHQAVTSLCSNIGLQTWVMFDSAGTYVPYENATSVLGQRILLIGSQERPQSRFRKLVRRVLPPILVDVIARVRRRRR